MFSRIAHFSLILLWISAVCIGVGWLWSYNHAAGASATPPERWPELSLARREAGRHTLVMFAHPKCPCTRAGIEELAKLMASCKGRLNAYVFFVTPKNSSVNWHQTDLWSSAARIPGVTAVIDQEGNGAAHFGSLTSGQVVLYDGLGRLVFSGGITQSRGHSGDNAGRTALESLVIRGEAETDHTLVFGCPLFDAGSECRRPDNEGADNEN